MPATYCAAPLGGPWAAATHKFQPSWPWPAITRRIKDDQTCHFGKSRSPDIGSSYGLHTHGGRAFNCQGVSYADRLPALILHRKESSTPAGIRVSPANRATLESSSRSAGRPSSGLSVLGNPIAGLVSFDR